MAFMREQTADGVVVVRVDGQLIVGNRQELKQVVQEAVDQGARRILIDFTPTAYIDSSGLGALVSINRKVHDVGGTLRLAGLNEDLASLFELTRLDTLFSIAGTVPEALAGF